MTFAGVNLTRLNPGRTGGGGAGHFGIALAAELAHLRPTRIFVQRSNIDAVVAGLGPDCTAEVVVVDMSRGVEAALDPEVADLSLYIDPLNGLEPLRTPRHVFTVAVIHDLLFVDKPYLFTQSELEFRRSHYGSAINCSDHVWTVSEEQARKIRHHYNASHVTSICQPGYFVLSDLAVKHENISDRRFLIYPAVQWNHKNHFRLFQAFLHLCRTCQIPDDIDLLYSGVFPSESNSTLHKHLAFHSSLNERLCEVPYFEENEYAALLSQSLGIVYPTTYEGWGVPVVEAALNGIPILTSRVPSLVSVG